MGMLTSKSFNPTTDIPDLNGKVAIVTGGKQAAIDFMKKEERLDILISDTLNRMDDSTARIQDVVMVKLVHLFEPTCSLEVCCPPFLRTAQEPGSDVRIVSGNKLCLQNVRFSSMEDLNRDFANSALPQFMLYSASSAKLMQLMFIEELQCRMDERNLSIICIATCLVAVNTDAQGVQAYAHSVGPILSHLYALITNLTFATPAKGAYSTVFAAASPVPRENADEYKGAFLKNPGVKTTVSPVAEITANLRELWVTTERILKEVGVVVQDPGRRVRSWGEFPRRLAFTYAVCSAFI
ncbi:hypothetical protein PYCCODRAFT_1468227 [Trametes coccinea BRFM310]|uniref:Uncharacterized protein n=1 Tax=Trametes coccinea (strain BRFM310) TaxID=1353009 RepID=A0A1Y2IMN5_TRAC3|nr:hypothetical protein PYCCODRAFT_1468227 [Trametes coccinea BRFM310]